MPLSVIDQGVLRERGTRPIAYGLHLLRSCGSDEYIHTIDVIEQSALFRPSGELSHYSTG